MTRCADRIARHRARAWRGLAAPSRPRCDLAGALAGREGRRGGAGRLRDPVADQSSAWPAVTLPPKSDCLLAALAALRRAGGRGVERGRLGHRARKRAGPRVPRRAGAAEPAPCGGRPGSGGRACIAGLPLVLKGALPVRMTRLWLVRHGPTHAKAMVGWTDLPADLSDTAALARLTAHLPADALVISSDLARAVATADALARRRAPAARPRLARIPLRRLGNARLCRDRGRDARPYPRLSGTAPATSRPPGGESWNAADHPASGRRWTRCSPPHPAATSSWSPISARSCRHAARRAACRPTQALAHRIDNLSVTCLSLRPRPHGCIRSITFRDGQAHKSSLCPRRAASYCWRAKENPMTYDLVIGDRAYSSWSLRGWLLFDAFGIPVKTHRARLYTDELATILREYRPRPHRAHDAHARWQRGPRNHRHRRGTGHPPPRGRASGPPTRTPAPPPAFWRPRCTPALPPCAAIAR